MLDRPEFAGAWMERGTLDVSVTKRPDLRPHALFAHEGVVPWYRAIRINADNLAQQTVHLLRLHAALCNRPVPLRHKQRSVAVPDQPAAEVCCRAQRRRLMVDDLCVVHARRCAIHQLSPTHRCIVTAFSWL